MSSTTRRRGAGRPRTFDDDQALDGALAHFWRHGYRATTTRDLEAAMGIGQSSISHAFGAKSDILDQALVRYRCRLDEEILHPLRESRDGVDAIGRFLRDVERWLLADGGRGCLIGRLMSEGADPEPVVRTNLDAYRRDLRTALLATLRRAVDAGEIDDVDREERVAVVSGLVLGMNLALQAGFGAALVRRIAAGGRRQVELWRVAPGACRPPAGPATPTG